MNIFLWHVHGSWTTSFVQGRHRYLVPVLPDRGPDGRGRARTWRWPDSVREVVPSAAAAADVDVVVLQRPQELKLAEEWLGRRPGVDVPAIYVEHDAPQGRVNEMRHVLAERSDIPLVHVTRFNRLFWDGGRAPVRVIEHGVVDPGYRYTGDRGSAAVVINEPMRRGRVTGTDLLPVFGKTLPYTLYGMQVEAVGGIEDLPQDRLHEELPRHALYLHPYRWTSLGLSLIEAMHLGMPVVALATTEVTVAVPREAGVVGTDVEWLRDEATALLHDSERRAVMGKAARESALERYGVDRFLADWDDALEAIAS
jgi:glycosyltransferase involved in cell wall biosynthesis